MGGRPASPRRRRKVLPCREPRSGTEALRLLAERFETLDHDGPSAYAGFLARPGGSDEQARLKREAVATVREFLAGFRGNAGAETR